MSKINYATIAAACTKHDDDSVAKGGSARVLDDLGILGVDAYRAASQRAIRMVFFMRFGRMPTAADQQVIDALPQRELTMFATMWIDGLAVGAQVGVEALEERKWEKKKASGERTNAARRGIRAGAEVAAMVTKEFPEMVEDPSTAPNAIRAAAQALDMASVRRLVQHHYSDLIGVGSFWDNVLAICAEVL